MTREALLARRSTWYPIDATPSRQSPRSHMKRWMIRQKDEESWRLPYLLDDELHETLPKQHVEAVDVGGSMKQAMMLWFRYIAFDQLHRVER
jgi:hypothetical protein